MHERRQYSTVWRMWWHGCVLATTVGLTSLAAHAQGDVASPSEVTAALKVLDQWRGRWDVTITTTRPVESTTKSVATNTWTLGERFLQGDSGTKSDGSRDLSMMTYDPLTRAYPLWIFSSTGVVYYLENGRWDAAIRTMTWDSNPITLAISYRYRCRFADDDTYRCQSMIKDWKGSVIFELETTGKRAR